MTHVNNSSQHVVFNLGERQFALRLGAVERVVRAVEVTGLPGAPEVVLGIINVSGKIIPVFNTRRRFQLPEREMEASDQFIITRTGTRTVALVVDAVRGIQESVGEEEVAAEMILPDMEHIKGVVKLTDGLILIHDLDKFLSLNEGKALDAAMEIPERDREGSFV